MGGELLASVGRADGCRWCSRTCPAGAGAAGREGPGGAVGLRAGGERGSGVVDLQAVDWGRPFRRWSAEAAGLSAPVVARGRVIWRPGRIWVSSLIPSSEWGVASRRGAPAGVGVEVAPPLGGGGARRSLLHRRCPCPPPLRGEREGGVGPGQRVGGRCDGRRSEQAMRRGSAGVDGEPEHGVVLSLGVASCGGGGRGGRRRREQLAGSGAGCGRRPWRGVWRGRSARCGAR